MDPYHRQRGMLAPLALAVLLVASALAGASVATETPAPEATASPSPTQGEVPLPAEGPVSMESAPPAVSEFSMAGYMNAVRTGKLVVLMYSSAGCAGCEQAFGAFSDAVRSIGDGRVVAFRVDYGDAAMDDEEQAAAGTFQVEAPHMLTVVRRGALAAKEDVTGWDAERFRAAISGFLR